jgi:holliday junction DNA helicase RuvA
MIACLRGELFVKTGESLIIDVNGIGYEVFVSRINLERLPDIGQEVFLHIHTEVREDALNLFGFPDQDEKRMFLLLLGVSGVGPKQALNILSGMVVAELGLAIRTDDIGRLTRISGVGKKTAERLCLELKDKVCFLSAGGGVVSSTAAPDPESGGAHSEDVLSALENLGYPPVRAREALKMVRQRTPPETFATMSLEELLRQALRSLA